MIPELNDVMAYDENYTEFLPAKRAPQSEILKSYELFNSEKLIKPIFDSIPGYFLILNKYRQVVYANLKLSEVIPGHDIKSVLGLRPGEIFNCVNALSSRGGCGTAKACSVCGAGLAILESMTGAIKSEKECRITTREDKTIGSLELMVTASPLVVNGDTYYILSLSDISNEKRRMMLERVFIHDVVNIAGGLKSIISLMKTPGQIDSDIDLLQMADVSTSSLLEEIEVHSSLISAENGQLTVHFQATQTADVLMSVLQILERNDAAITKMIAISKSSENVKFSTDKVMLRRILVNLTKNALEASEEGDIVTLGCHKTGSEVEFTVNNKGVMTEEIQLQIFQRSFSTKGNNRGLGTYSIKLLTEKYLGGRVTFSTNKKNGTIFKIYLPDNS